MIITIFIIAIFIIFFFITIYKKDIIEFKFSFTLPLKLNIEWKKRNIDNK